MEPTETTTTMAQQMAQSAAIDPNPWVDMAMKLGIPAAAMAAMGLLFGWIVRKWFVWFTERENRILEQQFAVEKAKRDDDKEQRVWNREVEVRRLDQMDKMLGIQHVQADNEKVQAAAMVSTSTTLAKLEETTRMIAGEGCGVNKKVVS